MGKTFAQNRQKYTTTLQKTLAIVRILDPSTAQ